MARLVLPVGLGAIEDLGAHVALELFLSQVDVIDVLIQNSLFKEGFSTLLADVGPSSGCRGVHSLIMLSQEAVHVGSIRTELAEKLLPHNLSVRLLDVVEKCALFCKGSTTRVAEKLPSS